MRSPETFDAYYVETRTRLLHEAYALTGDAPASRAAVRDAFVVTWHHWRKVGGLDDRDGYVRPLAFRRARRKHTARIWHRDKSLAPEVRATLDALSKLTPRQRELLVLNGLSSLSLTDIGRMVGLPRSDAERELQTATSQFSLARDVPTTDVRRLLRRPRRPAGGDPVAARDRHPSRGRRATSYAHGHRCRRGRRRPRRLGLAGGHGRRRRADEPARGEGVGRDHRPRPGAGRRRRASRSSTRRRCSPRPRWRASAPDLDWSETATTDNLSGNGLLAPCQRERFADPEGVTALARTWEGSATRTVRTKVGKGDQQRTRKRSETQRGVDRRPARRDVARRRPGGGELPDRLGLVRRVRRPAHPAHGHPHGQARRRRGPRLPAAVVGQAAGDAHRGRGPHGQPRGHHRRAQHRSRGERQGDPHRPRRLRQRALRHRGRRAPAPAGRARSRTAPLDIGAPPGFLSVVDLPPVASVRGPWVGTDPERARTNFAATRCDRTTFTGKRHHAARRPAPSSSPRRPTPPQLGLTQTIGEMTPGRARKFVETVRTRIRQCGQANLGTTVTPLASSSSKATDMSVWALSIELNDRQSFPFLMAIVRDGTAVSQLGFAPVRDHDDGARRLRRALAADARAPRGHSPADRPRGASRGLTQPFLRPRCLRCHEVLRSAAPRGPGLHVRARRVRQPAVG